MDLRSFPLCAAALLALSGALVIDAGTAAATSRPYATHYKTTAVCPPGSQIDPQNSQQCQSLSPPSAETSTSGCTSAGYQIDSRGSGYCVDAQGRDTFGSQH